MNVIHIWPRTVALRERFAAGDAAEEDAADGGQGLGAAERHRGVQADLRGGGFQGRNLQICNLLFFFFFKGCICCIILLHYVRFYEVFIR